MRLKKSLLVAAMLALASPAAGQCVVPNEGHLQRHDCYDNRYHHPRHVPSPSTDVPPTATARCRDGAYSFSEHRSGTCSGHHGVAQWLKSG
jgi:Protein of unknown function (DUF3761)